jgi:hypothetical protein
MLCTIGSTSRETPSRGASLLRSPSGEAIVQSKSTQEVMV